MNETDEFIQLKCPNCGGKLEFTKTQFAVNFVSVENDSVAIYLGFDAAADGVKCQYCGSTFARKERFERVGGGTAIATGDGSVAISGDVSGSVIVTGSIPPMNGKYNIVIGSAKNLAIGDGVVVDDEETEED